MNSGQKSSTSCAIAPRSRLGRLGRVGVLWKPCFGYCAVGRNGVYFLPNMASGTACTSALPVGVKRGYGSRCLNISLLILTWKMSCSMPPLSVLTPVLLEPQKKGGQAAQALGRSQGGFSTKIHVKADGLGNPLRFILTGGERHESTQAQPLLGEEVGEYVLGDRSYDHDDLIAFIIDHGAIPVIPSRKNRKQPRDYDTWRYRERALIECFMNKIKHYRRLFSRFDKLDTRFLGFLHFAATLIWLR